MKNEIKKEKKKQHEPRVVHHEKEAYDVFIARPSKWGNKFIVGRDGTRSEVIEKYRAWILTQPELMAALDELRGKVLGCWCHPKRCHGEVLLELANRPRGLWNSF